MKELMQNVYKNYLKIINMHPNKTLKINNLPPYCSDAEIEKIHLTIHWLSDSLSNLNRNPRCTTRHEQDEEQEKWWSWKVPDLPDVVSGMAKINNLCAPRFLGFIALASEL